MDKNLNHTHIKSRYFKMCLWMCINLFYVVVLMFIKSLNCERQSMIHRHFIITSNSGVPYGYFIYLYHQIILFSIFNMYNIPYSEIQGETMSIDPWGRAKLLSTSKTKPPISGSASNCSHWPQMGQIWDFLRSDFSTFWRTAPKCTEIWS